MLGQHAEINNYHCMNIKTIKEQAVFIKFVLESFVPIFISPRYGVTNGS
jgi:hypothetical protein